MQAWVVPLWNRADVHSMLVIKLEKLAKQIYYEKEGIFVNSRGMVTCR